MKRLLLLSVGLAILQCGHCQLDTSAFRAYVKSVYDDFQIPSMTVAMMVDGKIVLSEGYGLKSDANPTTPDDQTLYAIASLSKAFTAASIAMLVEEEKLAWDDPVIKHLPWFKLHDEYVTEHMTIEDLLCHRSGFITFDGDLLWYGTDYSRKEAIERLAARPLTHEFRAEFGYQNLMFMTAGEVIEAASGKSWDDFVKERILEPLDMNRTTSDFEKFSKDQNIAKPNINGDEIFMLSYNNSGATAALNSCTGDMMKWLGFWMNDGIIGEDTLLSKASIQKIWSLHTPLGVGNFDNQNGTHFKGYGLGWFLMDMQGSKVAHHGGGLPGYISKVAICEDDNAAIVVLTNDMTSVPSMLMYAMVDWLHGEDYTKRTEQFLDFKKRGAEREEQNKKKREQTKRTERKMLPIEDYVGTYVDKMYGEAEVFQDDKKLVLVLKPSKELFSGPITPWDDHTFRFNHNDPFLTYALIEFDVELDVIKGFTIDLPNNDFHFDKLYFERKP